MSSRPRFAGSGMNVTPLRLTRDAVPGPHAVTSRGRGKSWRRNRDLADSGHEPSQVLRPKTVDCDRSVLSLRKWDRGYQKITHISYLTPFVFISI